MKIDIKDFLSFQESPDSKIWDIGNGALYDLCKKYPAHTNADEVIAKIWLIGRAYAVAIERFKDRDKQESLDRFYKRAAEELMGSEIDKQIQRIPKENRLTKQNIKVIGEVHSFLARRFCKLTGDYKTSLASKYLHFHRPLVPLYDSIAKKRITEIFKDDQSYKELLKKISPEVKDSSDEKDKEYLGFVIKVFYLQQSLLSKIGKFYSMRDIDKYLLKQPEKR